jgi:hypothetical protein
MSDASQKYAMIIGAMKAGTSSLYRYLIQHPQICPCRLKEPEFFSDHQGHGCDVERYDDLWDFRKDTHAYCLEGSSGYAKFPEEPSVPENISTYGLDPRFIYLVRDPVERIVSEYNYVRQHPHMQEGALMNEERVARSRYHLQLQRFLEYFPDKERYLILRFEDLKNDPRGVVESVFQFLELPSHQDMEFGVYNETAAVSTAEQWFRKPGWYNVRQLVPAPMRASLRNALRRWTGAARRTLTAGERQTLREQLAPDAQKLSEAFGVDVQAWSLKEGRHV